MLSYITLSIVWYFIGWQSISCVQSPSLRILNHSVGFSKIVEWKQTCWEFHCVSLTQVTTRGAAAAALYRSRGTISPTLNWTVAIRVPRGTGAGPAVASTPPTRATPPTRPTPALRGRGTFPGRPATRTIGSKGRGVGTWPVPTGNGRCRPVISVDRYAPCGIPVFAKVLRAWRVCNDREDFTLNCDVITDVST